MNTKELVELLREGSGQDGRYFDSGRCAKLVALIDAGKACRDQSEEYARVIDPLAIAPCVKVYDEAEGA